LRDVNTICRRIWYLAAHIWKIYDFKIEVVQFIKNFSTELFMRLEPLISHTGILMTFYLSIILDLQNFFHWYISTFYSRNYVIIDYNIARIKTPDDHWYISTFYSQDYVIIDVRRLYSGNVIYKSIIT
jgi:hypothetical protein